MNATGPVRVERYATATAFLDAAGDFLVEREAEHNLIFGICATLTADPGYASEPYLATMSKAGRVVGAAVMTPPWNLVLSCTDEPDALTALAADLDAGGIAIPGTTGPVEIARRFADGLVPDARARKRSRDRRADLPPGTRRAARTVSRARSASRARPIETC